MLNYEYPPLGGGGSYACKNILTEYAKKNIDVDLVTSSSTNSSQIEKIGDSVNIYKLPINKKDIHYWTQREIITYSWKANKFIKSLMMEKNYDICHAFFGIPCGAIAYLFRKKIPYIVSLRGSDVPGFNERFELQYIILKPIIKKIWKEAGAVVANSEGLKELALKSSTDQDISVICNGINISEFKPDQDKINRNNELRIVCVSRLIERKGIRFLIEAVGILKNKEIKLVLVGEGNQEDELKKLAIDLGVPHKVEFKGYMNHQDMVDIYKNSDVFVLPSMNEGMSNALLEAMASGLPVIATRTGGTAELVDGNGIIVPMGDSKAIADGIKRLISNPDERRSMGLKSRENVKTRGWGTVADAYLKVYNNVIYSRDNNIIKISCN